MRSAYLLAEAIIAIIIAGIVAAVFTTMNYYTHVQANLLKQQNSKIILEVARSRLVNLAADPDTDSYFELLKQEADDTLPLSVGLGTDAWGNRIFYATIDLGISDGTNAPYADTNTSISPNANIAGRLVCPGQDGVVQTLSTDAVSQGDDIMLEIGIGELNHYKLYGGSEISTQTRGYNSAIISNTAPTTPIDGTLWYDTTAGGKLKVYDQNTTSWIII